VRSWHWTRLYRNGVFEHWGDDLEINTEERQRIFGNALISWDNRNVKFTGWLNPWHNNQFWEIALSRYPERYIPF